MAFREPQPTKLSTKWFVQRGERRASSHRANIYFICDDLHLHSGAHQGPCQAREHDCLQKREILFRGASCAVIR